MQSSVVKSLLNSSQSVSEAWLLGHTFIRAVSSIYFGNHPPFDSVCYLHSAYPGVVDALAIIAIAVHAILLILPCNTYYVRSACMAICTFFWMYAAVWSSLNCFAWYPAVNLVWIALLAGWVTFRLSMLGYTRSKLVIE